MPIITNMESSTRCLEAMEPKRFPPGELPGDERGETARSWLRVLYHDFRVAWCQNFHRAHYQRQPLEESRSKVHCARCGRTFVRERRVVSAYG